MTTNGWLTFSPVVANPMNHLHLSSILVLIAAAAADIGNDDKRDPGGNAYLKIKLEVAIEQAPIGRITLLHEVSCQQGFLLSYLRFNDVQNGELQIYEPATDRFSVAEANVDNGTVRIIRTNRQPGKGLSGAGDLLTAVAREGTNYLETYRTLISGVGLLGEKESNVTAEVLEFDGKSSKYRELAFQPLYEEIAAAWCRHLETRSNK